MRLRFDQHKLNNGLTIIGEHNSSALSISCGFFVKTGARDETSELSGVSHFLEHMMFKGTGTRTALDIAYQLGALGAQANAYTSEENTVYYLSVLPEYFPVAFELLSDMLRPSLDPTEFDLEKKVILEEIALYLDRPQHVLFESAIKEFFKSHPAGNSVLGTTESVSALTRAQMEQYFNRRYAPDNIVLAVTGNFDWSEVCELAEKYCGKWLRGEPGRLIEHHLPVYSELELHRADLQRAHLCLLAPGPSAQEKERYAADLLCCILGDGTGSRTYWSLIDKGLADTASVDLECLDGTGFLYAYLTSSQENLERCADILQEIFETPLNFTDSDLEQAITKLATRLVLQGESTLHRLMPLGSNWIYRAAYSSLDEELAAIKGVSRRSIEQLVERYPFKVTNKIAMVAER